MKAEVTKKGALDMQVCVPESWDDQQVINFGELHNPCGTACGWRIREQGDKYLDGKDERVNCDDRKGFVHIMLDA